MAYAELSELRAYLGVESNDDDALLQGFLASAQALIDKQAGRTFEATADESRTFDEWDVAGDLLILGADLCSVTSVVEYGSALVRNDDYYTRPRVDSDAPFYALRRADNMAWDGDGEVVVTGRWAYSVTAPDDIRHATVRLAAYLYRQKDNAAGDLDRTVVVGGTTILPAVFPHDVERMLRPYKRVTV